MVEVKEKAVVARLTIAPVDLSVQAEVKDVIARLAPTISEVYAINKDFGFIDEARADFEREYKSLVALCGGDIADKFVEALKEINKRDDWLALYNANEYSKAVRDDRSDFKDAIDVALGVKKKVRAIAVKRTVKSKERSEASKVLFRIRKKARDQSK